MTEQNSLQLGIVQYNPQFGAPAKNRNALRTLLSECGADLVVLPELCVTGYQFTSQDEIKRLAEPVPDGPTTRFFEKLARRESCYYVFGQAERAGGRYYNSAVLVGPEGYIATYRKIHLFDDEALWFSPGNLKLRVHDILGCRVGMLVCFDWLFPEVWRTMALDGADVICHPCNLVLPGMAQKGTVTRAVENRMFIAMSNRTGREARNTTTLRFTGRSQIVAPDGRLLAACGPREQRVRIVRIHPHDAREKTITPRNHVLHDRRVRLYTGLLDER
jgi:predicted amidohydrolase